MCPEEVQFGLAASTTWATMSYLALSSYASTAASDQIHFVWDSSKGKSIGSDHPFTYKRHYNLVCALRRFNLGWPPAPHWTTISCLAPPTSASTAASLQIHFVWDSSKRKSTGSGHHPTYKRYYNLVCAQTILQPRMCTE